MLLNEDQIDMAEFRALRQIEHIDKSNRDRFIAFYRKHINFDAKGTKTCRTCWDRMRARRDDVHQAWDANHERLEAERQTGDERMEAARENVRLAELKLDEEAARAVREFKEDSTKAYTNTKTNGTSTEATE